MAPGVFPHAHPCALASHPSPLRGDATGLAQHDLPRRGQAGTSVRSFGAHEDESQVVCFANAPLPRRAQAGAALQGVACGPERTGVHPQWRDFAAQVVPSPERSPLHQRGLWCVTLRRRRSALPARPWRQAGIDTAPRRPQRIRSLEETVHLPGSQGSRRPRAVTGLGRAQPTWFLSNNTKERARALMVRSASRHRVADGLGSSVHCLHLACVASEGRLHGERDTTLTVLAHGCYRWLAKQLRGLDTAAPQQRYRQCVDTAGVGDLQPERLVVHGDKRCHNPILREAALDQPSQGIPWLRNLPVVFQYP